MVYPYNGILFSCKRQRSSDTYYKWIKLKYVKWNKPDTKEQILYDSAFMSYLGIHRDRR